MRARISHVSGYGWHAGRLLVWPALWFAAMMSPFLLVPLELLAQGITRLDFPYALTAPALLGLWTRRRLRRKFAGEPFVWDRYMTDEYQADLIRVDDANRFRLCVRLEVLIWGGAAVLQTFLLAGYYLHRYQLLP